MRILLGIVILLFMPLALLLADQPPSWDEFQNESANKKFVAKVAIKDKKGKERPWEWSYTLTVYKADDVKKALWSCDYPYDGYPGGYLADDGATFADVNFWYYDDSAVVTIYQNGELAKRFNGSDFRIEKAKLQKTASHLRWLADDKQPNYSGTGELVIPTIDGKTSRIDLAKRELKKGS